MPEVRAIYDMVTIKPGIPVKMGDMLKLASTSATKKTKGTKKKWDRRFFVLEDDLKYWKDEDSYMNQDDPKGTLRLDCFFAAPAEEPNPKHQFSIFALGKSLICRADSREDMEDWIDVINNPKRRNVMSEEDLEEFIKQQEEEEKKAEEGILNNSDDDSF